MRSWLVRHVAPSEPRRLDEHSCEQSFVLSHWHPARTMAGGLGHQIR